MSYWKERLIRAEERSLEMSLANDDFLEAPPLENADFINTDDATPGTSCPTCNDTGIRSYHEMPGPYGSEPCSFCDPRRNEEESQ